MITVLIRRHEVIPKCGSFGVRYSDGRPSQYFYWEDVPGRRLRPDLVTSDVALEQAKALARAERSPSETCPVCNRVAGDQVPELSEEFLGRHGRTGLAPLITETGVRGVLLSGLSGDAFSALAMPLALSLGRGHRASYWAMPMPLASHFCPLRLHGAAR